MKNPKNVVIKKGCHSRMSLSGIYNACCCQIKDDSLLNKCVEDPRVLRTAKSGMTTLYNTPSPRCWRTRPLPQGARKINGGFTLIELLVVVLIIGILAAVAVPQYRLAVEKSRAVKILPLLDAIYKAQKVYYLANGEYATNTAELDIDLPLGSSSTQGGNYQYINYDDKTRITLCGNCPSVQARPNTRLNYYLEFYYGGSKSCWAHENDTLANKVCHILSGKDSTYTHNSMNRYLL